MAHHVTGKFQQSWNQMGIFSQTIVLRWQTAKARQGHSSEAGSKCTLGWVICFWSDHLFKSLIASEEKGVICTHGRSFGLFVIPRKKLHSGAVAARRGDQCVCVGGGACQLQVGFECLDSQGSPSPFVSDVSASTHPVHSLSPSAPVDTLVHPDSGLYVL